MRMAVIIYSSETVGQDAILSNEFFIVSARRSRHERLLRNRGTRCHPCHYPHFYAFLARGCGRQNKAWGGAPAARNPRLGAKQSLPSPRMRAAAHHCFV